MTNPNPFGKTDAPSALSSFGSEFHDPLDDAMEREQANRNKGGSGGAGLSWVPELRIDASGPVTMVFHDTRGLYTNQTLTPDGQLMQVKANNVLFVDHFSRITNKPAKCSAVPWSLASGPEAREKAKHLCTGCLCWSDGWGKDASGKYKHDGKIGKKPIHGFSVLVLDHVIDVPGNTKKTDGSYYTNQKLRSQVDKALWAKHGAGAKFGIRMPLNLARGGHYDQMFGKGRYKEEDSILHQVGQNCVGCGASNSIENKGWVCSQCSSPVLPEGSLRGDVKQWLDEGKRCEVCNSRELREDIICNNAQCQAPQRAQLFNSIITLRGTAVPGGDPNKKPAVVLQLAQWKPFRKEQWTQKLAPEMFEPLDLERILAGTSPERQQKVFGMLAPGLSLPSGMTAKTEDYSQAAPHIDDSDTPF